MQNGNKNIRIKFLPGGQKRFISHLYLKTGLSTKQLSQIADVCPRSFIDWRREKLNMSLKAAETFCEQFGITLPERKETLIKRWLNIKHEASRKGGIALFQKHGSPATTEGRRIGGIKSIANLQRNGIVPRYKIYQLPALCEELAEYVGIMLGDGGITASQCTITLNSEADANYILFINNFAESLFREKPRAFKHKHDKAITLYYNGSFLVNYFVKLGLKIGNKVKQQVDIPQWIKDSQKLRIACLRGLMDTDGGVFLHKYKLGGKDYVYKKISFSNRSIPILLFVHKTLEELGFRPKIRDKVDNKKVWLYNSKDVELYLTVVGTHNPRLLRYQLVL